MAEYNIAGMFHVSSAGGTLHPDQALARPFSHELQGIIHRRDTLIRYRHRKMARTHLFI